MSYVATYIMVIVISILSNVFVALAINSDAKARDLKGKAVYVDLAILFPLIVGIVYLCKRNKMPKLHPKMCNRCCNYVDENVNACPYCSSSHFSTYHNDKSKKLKQTSIVFLVLAIVFYIIGVIVANYSAVPLAESIDNAIPSTDYNIEAFDDLSFYDMKGNAYDDLDDVVFYAKDGAQYLNVRDEAYNSFFVNTEDKNEKYEGVNCYVDVYGYFVYDKDSSIVLDDSYATAHDSDGNIYYPAELATWNSRGDLLN